MLTNSGNRVNNLVLIGSPISNNFLDSLKKNPLISNVIVVNLNQHGDPLYAGMPFSTLVQSVKTLGEQQAKGTGHFYYAPAGAEGDARRRELARTLYDAGVK